MNSKANEVGGKKSLYAHLIQIQESLLTPTFYYHTTISLRSSEEKMLKIMIVLKVGKGRKGH